MDEAGAEVLLVAVTDPYTLYAEAVAREGAQVASPQQWAHDYNKEALAASALVVRSESASSNSQTRSVVRDLAAAVGWEAVEVDSLATPSRLHTHRTTRVWRDTQLLTYSHDDEDDGACDDVAENSTKSQSSWRLASSLSFSTLLSLSLSLDAQAVAQLGYGAAVYVHVPKTGGTFTRAWLASCANAPRSAGHRPELEAAHVLTLREPAARYESLLSFRLRPGSKRRSDWPISGEGWNQSNLTLDHIVDAMSDQQMLGFDPFKTQSLTHKAAREQRQRWRLGETQAKVALSISPSLSLSLVSEKLTPLHAQATTSTSVPPSPATPKTCPRTLPLSATSAPCRSPRTPRPTPPTTRRARAAHSRVESATASAASSRPTPSSGPGPAAGRAGAGASSTTPTTRDFDNKRRLELKETR